MNSNHPESTGSGYYPPRARWFSRWWYPWNHLRQISILGRIPPLGQMSARDFLLSALLPGYVLRFFHFKRTSTVVMAGFLASLATFLVAYGHLAANIAFGLMVAAHAVSLGMLLQRWLVPDGLRARLVMVAFSLLVVCGLVYVPMRRQMLVRFLPLDTGRGVVIVRCEKAAPALQRGQTIAFKVPQTYVADQVYLAGGYGIEQILGVAGDRIEFNDDGYRVNGERHAALRNMPAKGEIVVPEKHFFVWPRYDITVRNVPAANVASGLMNVSVVGQDQIIGRPCRSWFGMRQPVP